MPPPPPRRSASSLNGATRWRGPCWPSGSSVSRPKATWASPAVLPGSAAGGVVGAAPFAAAGDPAALTQIDGLVNVQALMISYVNDFKLMMIVTLCAVPLVFLLRKPAPAAGGEAPAAHME